MDDSLQALFSVENTLSNGDTSKAQTFFGEKLRFCA
jgi:hypothetical protein